MKNFSLKSLQYVAVVGVISLFLTSCQFFSFTRTTQESSKISTAQMSQTVDLKDGDTYELTAASVKKIIN